MNSGRLFQKLGATNYMYNLTPSDYFTAIAAIGALGSVFYASYSLRVAKKALVLAERDAADKNHNIDIYYVDGFRDAMNIDGAQFALFGFLCNIFNKSSIPNSIKSIDLVIYYSLHNTDILHFITHQTQNIPSQLPVLIDNVFSTPIDFAPKSSNTAWAVFLVPSHKLTDRLIDRYVIRITDISDRRSEIKINLLMTMKHAKINQDTPNS